MTEILIGRADSLRDGSVIIISTAQAEIGVFRRGTQFYAYENLCVHQGGPVCEGVCMPKVEDVMSPGRTLLGQRFDENEIHIVCPWHGYEYKLETGECIGDSRLRLRKFEVVERDEYLYVIV